MAGSIVKEKSGFKDESDLEKYVRHVIAERVSRHHRGIYALENNKVVDIVVCRDRPDPAVFFIEVKYRQKSHSRLGFGGAKGRGFQPEVLQKSPRYLERNLRWVLSSDRQASREVLFVDSKTIRKYVMGGSISDKFNNIRTEIFDQVNWLGEDDFAKALTRWLTGKDQRSPS